MSATSISTLSDWKPISLTAEGLRLAGAIHKPHSRGPFPWVVLSHGLFSDKDSPKYIQLADDIAKAGMAAVRFDYRGCGQSEGFVEDTTISGRLKDLQEIVRFVIEHTDCTGRIGLMGSSLGGYLSLLQTPREPRIMATVVWATPSHLNDLEKKKAKGDLPKLGDAFYQDLKRYDLLRGLGKVKNVLIIHGDQDEMVPVEHAFKMNEYLQSPKEIHILPEGDHRLTEPADRKKATALTVSWFKKFL